MKNLIHLLTLLGFFFASLSTVASKSMLEEFIEERKNEGKKKLESDEAKELSALSDRELIERIQTTPSNEIDSFITLIGSERLKDIPAKVFMEKFEVSKAKFEVMTNFSLKKLFYPEGIEGVNLFQIDLGQDETGIITFGQFMTLMQRSAQVEFNQVIPLGVLEDISVYIDKDFASVKGTWIIEGEQIAHQNNFSEIECNRSWGVCIEARSEVIVPSIDSVQKDYYLDVSLIYYDIISWENDEVIAKRNGTQGTSLLTLNRKENEVFGLTTNGGADFVFLPKLKGSRVSRLVAGYDVTSKWWRDRASKTSEFYNKDFKKGVNQQLVKTGSQQDQ